MAIPDPIAPVIFEAELNAPERVLVSKLVAP